jgi:hypothetical protein
MLVMMMLACITLKNGIVTLLEGLCAQILYFQFEIQKVISGLRSHLLLFFCERKIYIKEKSS